jgi:hypothetical protein
MPSEKYPDTVLQKDNLAFASAAAAETKYRWWVRGSAADCWRELRGEFTMAEMSRIQREEQFAEFSLIDGSARLA